MNSRQFRLLASLLALAPVSCAVPSASSQRAANPPIVATPWPGSWLGRFAEDDQLYLLRIDSQHAGLAGMICKPNPLRHCAVLRDIRHSGPELGFSIEWQEPNERQRHSAVARMRLSADGSSMDGQVLSTKDPRVLHLFLRRQ